MAFCRNARVAAIVASLLIGCAAQAADSDFKAFWTNFKQALAKNDKEAIASMTKLPYGLEDKKLNKAQYIAQLGTIFPAKARKCISTSTPRPDGKIMEVFCGESIYIFEKVDGKYLFTEIGAND